ncbi:MAG: phosphate acyltransferase PlsX [Candidatus Omnitrophota bacterium]
MNAGSSVRIAVDGMGGDHAPSVVVEGAIQAARDFGYQILIVGQEDVIKSELEKHSPIPEGISIHHAQEVVDMHEPATTPIRKKKDSSINMCVKLVQENKADAIVSAGNTGAAVCATTLRLGLLKGVQRPGIAILFPTLKGITMLIDVGANIDPKPEHLLQYGIMGDAYLRHILGNPNPSIGLLNVGEEDTKGPDFTKQTHQLLSESRLNFIGNVEGRDIYSGECDVIVCDGFVGNVVLKVSESLAFTISVFLKRELKKGIMSKLGVLLSSSAFRIFKKKVDYAEYGGAPLLGVDGRVIIGHGSSNAKAIRNAIRVAAEFKEKHINQHIVEEIEQWKK